MAPTAAPEIFRNADLSPLSSFRLPARAAELVFIEHARQLDALPPAENGELVLGGGSNTLFIGNYSGRVLVNRLRGIDFQESGDGVCVTAAAGENWHRLVRTCLDRGLYGVENLVMIPGSVGAAPMQNIGAYGVELSDVLQSLSAVDRLSGQVARLARDECEFAYRDSRFKSRDRDRFLITSVSLRLSPRFEAQTGYASLAEALDRAGIERPSPRQLVAAIMRLRRHRLPDPCRLPNAGSFFKNPVVDAAGATALLEQHPNLPHWPMPGGRVKLAAAWMIEQLGWKGKSIGDAGVYRNHALVLVNHGQATAGELLQLVERITASVQQHFGVCLQAEPQLIGRQDTSCPNQVA